LRAAAVARIFGLVQPLSEAAADILSADYWSVIRKSCETFPVRERDQEKP
jgi:hypothetical protein